MIRPTFRIEEKNPDGFRRFRDDLRDLDGSFVKVGFPIGAKPGAAKTKRVTIEGVGSYPKISGSGRSAYSDMEEVARVAAWNEFGVPMKSRVKKLGETGKTGRYLAMQERTDGLKRWNKGFWFIPPRPFFRTAVDSSREALSNHIDRTVAAFMLGKSTPQKVLELVGVWMQNRIKRTLTTGNWIPNADITKRRKKSSKPLIDTGQMRNSVTFTTHSAGEPCEREGTVVIR